MLGPKHLEQEKSLIFDQPDEGKLSVLIIKRTLDVVDSGSIRNSGSRRGSVRFLRNADLLSIGIVEEAA